MDTGIYLEVNMPRADFFARLGLFVDTQFLDPEACVRLRGEMRSASGRPATVVEKQGPADAVDEETRRTKSAKVSESALSLVEERLLTIKPKLASHFGVTLRGWQPPQFLVYRRGDFFRTHPDISNDPGAPQFVKDRRVSIVMFLNDESPEPKSDCYSGGSLTFYGLLKDPRSTNIGLPLVGQAGLLVAFRPEVLHEVTEVTDGERYTIVSWFV